MPHATSPDDVPIKKGPWSPEEDALLRAAVEAVPEGKRTWAEIAAGIPGRTAKQCRERWEQNLNPSINKDPISETEGLHICNLVDAHGKKWADIARALGNRSDNQVKNWYNGMIQKYKTRRISTGNAAYDRHFHTTHQETIARTFGKGPRTSVGHPYHIPQHRQPQEYAYTYHQHHHQHMYHAQPQYSPPVYNQQAYCPHAYEQTRHQPTYEPAPQPAPAAYSTLAPLQLDPMRLPGVEEVKQGPLRARIQLAPLSVTNLAESFSHRAGPIRGHAARRSVDTTSPSIVSAAPSLTREVTPAGVSAGPRTPLEPTFDQTVTNQSSKVIKPMTVHDMLCDNQDNQD